MIKTVVKRNGDVVAFDPTKLSKWAEWASVVGVDWFEIVGDAYKKCSDGVSTQELHKALISACIDKETSPALLMAGRLMVGEVYKELFGGVEHIPDLSTFYHSMIEQGYWEDMDYSEEDLAYLNSVINHANDFNLTSTQVTQDVQKYLITDVTTQQTKETPQFALMRQAMGAHKAQPKDRRLKDVAGMYNDLQGVLNTPTPNKNNLGTSKRSYASCCKSMATDGINSIEAQNHINWTMTAASAGQGNYLQTRSIGDKIRGGTIKHGGKIPYFRVQEAECSANKQGGRGGAVTSYLNALDPEIFTLLALRNPTSVDDKRIDGMDYAFQFNESFVRRSKKNEDWLLVSYQKAPELWEAFFDREMTRFDSIMDSLIQSGDVGEVVKARSLLLKFLSENEVTGRLYEFNATNVNKHSSFKETIYSSNLCVTPDTKILVKEGYVPIGKLEGKDVEVWNGSEWSATKVVKTGENQEIIRVVTKDGYTLECTPYHKFYKIDQSKGNNTTIIEVRAIDLLKGDKLIKFDLPIIEGCNQLEHAWANGFYSGDGYFFENKQFISFYHGKQSMIGLLGDCIASIHKPDVVNNRTIVKVKGLMEKFFVPDCSYTIQSRLDWLAGLLDSDGTLCFNGNTQSFQIGSINKPFLQEIQLMLQTCGVKSKVTKNADEGYRPLPANNGTGESKMYLCQTAYRLLIGNDGVSKLQDLGLKTHRLKPTAHRPNRECSQFIKIDGVYSDGKRSDTYCFTEPKRNMGMFNGLLTGQCLEYLAPTKPFSSIKELYYEGNEAENAEGEVAICNLAAISVGKFPMSKYDEVAYRTLLMVDNVIEIGTFPLPQVEYTAKARRTAGIGITNLAYALADRGLTYDSQEGKAYIHRLAEQHMFSLLKASVQLAKEKGKCKWYHKTRYSEGWLPIDTYNKNVDAITSQPLLCDWEWLRKEIAEHGLRNSALVNHMPAESSSVRNGDTNSLYPIREGVVIKKSGNTKVVFLAPDWERLQGFYQSAWDIESRHIYDLYAICTKFSDQGISADEYRVYGMDKKISAMTLMKNFFYRADSGMKTRYYTNMKVGASEVKQEDSCGGGGCKL